MKTKEQFRAEILAGIEAAPETYGNVDPADIDQAVEELFAEQGESSFQNLRLVIDALQKFEAGAPGQAEEDPNFVMQYVSQMPAFEGARKEISQAIEPNYAEMGYGTAASKGAANLPGRVGPAAWEIIKDTLTGKAAMGLVQMIGEYPKVVSMMFEDIVGGGMPLQQFPTENMAQLAEDAPLITAMAKDDADLLREGGLQKRMVERPEDILFKGLEVVPFVGKAAKTGLDAAGYAQLGEKVLTATEIAAQLNPNAAMTTIPGAVLKGADWAAKSLRRQPVAKTTKDLESRRQLDPDVSIEDVLIQKGIDPDRVPLDVIRQRPDKKLRKEASRIAQQEFYSNIPVVGKLVGKQSMENFRYYKQEVGRVIDRNLERVEEVSRQTGGMKEAGRLASEGFADFKKNWETQTGEIYKELIRKHGSRIGSYDNTLRAINGLINKRVKGKYGDLPLALEEADVKALINLKETLSAYKSDATPEARLVPVEGRHGRRGDQVQRYVAPGAPSPEVQRVTFKDIQKQRSSFRRIYREREQRQQGDKVVVPVNQQAQEMVYQAMTQDMKNAISDYPDDVNILANNDQVYASGVAKFNSAWGRKIQTLAKEERYIELVDEWMLMPAKRSGTGDAGFLNEVDFPQIMQTVGEDAATAIRGELLIRLYEFGKKNNAGGIEDMPLDAKRFRETLSTFGGRERLNDILGPESTQSLYEVQTLLEAAESLQKELKPRVAAGRAEIADDVLSSFSPVMAKATRPVETPSAGFAQSTVSRYLPAEVKTGVATSAATAYLFGNLAASSPATWAASAIVGLLGSQTYRAFLESPLKRKWEQRGYVFPSEVLDNTGRAMRRQALISGYLTSQTMDEQKRGRQQKEKDLEAERVLQSNLNELINLRSAEDLNQILNQPIEGIEN